MLVAYFLVLLRMFYLQIIRADYFQNEVVSQRVKTIEQQSERGKIIDSNGNVLAMSLLANDIGVFPKFINKKEEQEKLATILSTNLKLPYKQVLKKLKSGKEYDVIARRVDPEITNKIKKEMEKEHLGGVNILKSPKRYYPNGNLAGSILGLVNFNNQANAGLELSMDNFLAGVPGYTMAETYKKEKIIPVGFNNTSSPVDGQNVKLTIDSYLQHVMEDAFKQAQKKLHPISMHGILMNPKNGEIYAMASYPSFNPNKYESAKTENWTRNPGSFVYEPGSIFKPLYMAMALDNGYVDEKTEWYDGSGTINVNGTPIRNNNGEVYGKLDLRSIIVHSSNVGMVHISQTMKSEEVVNGLKKIGVGQKTGVELPAEETGLIPTTEMLNNDPLMKATESFGQGIAVTPVQIASIFSSLINGGHKVNAKLVKEVKDNYDNILYEANDKQDNQEFKPKTVELMKSYLKANMEEGSGKDLQLDGYDGGGKTGTAWKVDPKTHGYKGGAFIGSFLGFAPFDNPEFVLLISVDEPKGVQYGGQSAGPIWHDIMQEALRYKGVPKKEQQKEETKVNVPNVKWMLYEDAKNVLKNAVGDVEVEKNGVGEVVESVDYNYKNNKLCVELYMKPILDKDFFYIPSLNGKSKSEVKDILKGYKVKVKFHGEGKVKEQNLEPGRNNIGDSLILWLE